MNKTVLSAVLILLSKGITGQQKKDTVNIDQVVITGQYSPQSIKKSLYKVEVITAADIQRMSANNVAEILNQSLNILIVPERNSGDSKANILGLRSDYTKVLVDNIPLIGDTGLGSNIDLTKISLENVERIELVKGSMGVEFGNNAVAGVINIITKKSARKNWNVRGFVQEETAGKEYDWVDIGKGRHIQALNVSHNFGDGKWFADLGFNRNDFQGFWGEKQGKNYFEQDGNRGYEWLPKEQWNPSFLLKYGKANTQIFYKGDYLLEKINFYNPLVNAKYLGAGERTFTAVDRDYFTTRMLHHLGITATVFRNAKYSGDFSYQKQTRKFQDYIFDIPARQKISTEAKNTYYQAETYYSRGTLSNFFKTEKINFLLGYEGDYTRGFSGWSTGKYNDENVTKDVLNAAALMSAEMQLTDSWFFRPGIRVNFSDTFKTVPSFSLVLKNNIDAHSEFRAIVGTSNRNPTFEELFTYFVDSNHNITGNTDLKPENSYSGTLFYTLSGEGGSATKWSLDASTMYLQIHNRIDMVQTSATPLKYKYMNVESYQSWENALSAKLQNKNYGISAGFSLLGNTMAIAGNEVDKMYFTPQANAAFYYNIDKSGTSFAANLKTTGKSRSYFEDKSLGITQYILGERKGFTLADASVSQKLWKDYISITAGVRNIFNVTNVQNLLSATGAHGSSPSEMLFYGRSYFGRLNFNF